MMDDNLVNKIVELVKPVNPRKIILYGSMAKRESSGASDIDLCMVMPGRPKVGDKAKLFKLLSKGGYDWEVDPDFYLISDQEYQRRLSENDLFTRKVDEGKVVYESG